MARKHPILRVIAVAGATATIYHVVNKHEQKKQMQMQEEYDAMQEEMEQERIAVQNRIKFKPKNIRTPNNNFAGSAKAQYLASHQQVSIKNLANDDLINDGDEMEMVEENVDDDY